MDSNKQKLELYVHFELLDNKASAVVASVMIVPFRLEEGKRPTDCSEKVVIHTVTNNDIIKNYPHSHDFHDDFNEFLKSNGCFYECVMPLGQIADNRTISEDFIKHRFQTGNAWDREDILGYEKFSAECDTRVKCNVKRYLYSLCQKYSVTLWVNRMDIEGEILCDYLSVDADLPNESFALPINEINVELMKNRQELSTFEKELIPYDRCVKAINFIYYNLNKLIPDYEA